MIVCFGGFMWADYCWFRFGVVLLCWYCAVRFVVRGLVWLLVGWFLFCGICLFGLLVASGICVNSVVMWRLFTVG